MKISFYRVLDRSPALQDRKKVEARCKIAANFGKVGIIYDEERKFAILSGKMPEKAGYRTGNSQVGKTKFCRLKEWRQFYH